MYTKSENWEKLRDPAYRHALAIAQFKRFVPFQISALRKQKQWSQQQLANSAGLTQGVVSRAEDPDNGNLAVNTILRIANGLDCVFVGQFMSYAEFEQWRRKLSEDTVVLDFHQEDVKFERGETESALHESVTAKYLEALAARNVAPGKHKPILELIHAPANQKLQMWLPISSRPDLRVVYKAFANGVQNAPAQEAKMTITGVQ